LDILETSLYYEADAHTGVFADTRIVWLVFENEIDMSVLDNYALRRMNMYRRHLGNADSFSRISDWAWTTSRWKQIPKKELDYPGYRRDFQFYGIIKDTISSQDGDWALVIVGASHVADRYNSMRRLLEQDKVQCIVNIVKPQ